MSDTSGYGPSGEFFNPTPLQEQQAFDQASSYLRDETAKVVQSATGLVARVEAVADEFGPTLPVNCRGQSCPVLSAISSSHRAARHSVAWALQNRETIGETLKIISDYNEQHTELLGLVMDNALRNDIPPEVVEAKLDSWDQYDAERESMFGTLPSEREVLDRFEKANTAISEGKEKIKLLEELYATVCPTKRGILNSVSVVIRRALHSPPKDGECYGSKFVPLPKNKGDILCTNSSQAEVFLDAVDSGLVTLYASGAHIETPPATE